MLMALSFLLRKDMLLKNIMIQNSVAHEVIFSCKRSVSSHPPLPFNNIPVAQTNSQKHLRMQLDKKLRFEEQLKKVESNVNKTIGNIRKLQNVLPRLTLLTITSHSSGVT